MIRGFRNHAYGGDQFVSVMHVIIAAQHFVVEFRPVFERMTGGAQADERFA